MDGVNPDKCNAPHTHVASFFCEMANGHTGDHMCGGPESALKPVTRFNRDGYLREGWTRIDLGEPEEGESIFSLKDVTPEEWQQWADDFHAIVIRENIRRGHP